MKYSPMNDCGRTSQRASSRRSARPGSVTLASTTASGCACPSRWHVAGLAGLHARDLEVAALGEAEGVVQHDLYVLPGAVVVALAPEASAAARTRHDGRD